MFQTEHAKSFFFSQLHRGVNMLGSHQINPVSHRIPKCGSSRGGTHSQDTRSVTRPGWVSVAMVTCFLQTALTMSSVAMAADENMYAGFFFFMRNIKNRIISVSMVTSEYRSGKRALYFATDPRLYLEERRVFKADQAWTQCSEEVILAPGVSSVSLIPGPPRSSAAGSELCFCGGFNLDISLADEELVPIDPL